MTRWQYVESDHVIGRTCPDRRDILRPDGTHTFLDEFA